MPGTLQFLNSSADRFTLGDIMPASKAITFTLSGTGLLNVDKTQYGAWLGNQGAAGTAGVSGSPSSVTINQSGGTAQFGVTTSGGTATKSDLNIGSSVATNYYNATYALSGGILRVGGNVQVGVAPGTGSTLSFNWTGGRLVAAGYIATNLTSNDGVSGAAAGTLFNANGTLAPGDLGISGLTAITGNYTQESTGTLAVDLGGTTASAAFQDTGLGKFDRVTVSGTATLAGNLSVSLLPGYAPLSTDTFGVLSVTGSTIGTFGTVTGTDGSVFTVNYASTGPAAQTLQLAANGLNQWQGGSGTN